MAARRVVTGRAADGKGHVVSDGPAPCVLATEDVPGFQTVYVWATDAVPHVPNAGADPTRLDQKFFPGPEGSRFLINVFPLGFGAAPGHAAGAGPHGDVFMHATSTIDYGVVLRGEVTLILDSGEEVTLRAMDTVVQNGTVHGWRNASAEPAIVAFVVLGAEAAEASSPRDEVEGAAR
ncbi:cupin domain-containing protein [Streptomyces sp. NPDC002896]|uniref:cupin domain-containing protein n=1 Tax=Streptomyces sp. NPDC002896 TaxID=3154438 RepID=UPI0033167C86